jgi:hypothetical protein
MTTITLTKTTTTQPLTHTTYHRITKTNKQTPTHTTLTIDNHDLNNPNTNPIIIGLIKTNNTHQPHAIYNNQTWKITTKHTKQLHQTLKTKKPQ